MTVNVSSVYELYRINDDRIDQQKAALSGIERLVEVNWCTPAMETIRMGAPTTRESIDS